MALKQKALELCWKIEELPASELQTEVSVMASELKAEIEGLLPKLEILRKCLFKVDHQLSPLDEELLTKEPAQVIEYTIAFLSVLELYIPSAEEEREAQRRTKEEEVKYLDWVKRGGLQGWSEQEGKL